MDTGTGHLWNHLATKHRIHRADLTTLPPPKEKKPKWCPSDPSQISAVEKLTNLFVKRGISFSIVDSKEFGELCEELQPHFAVPGARALKRSITQQVEKVQEEFVVELRNAKYCGISFDGWDDASMRHHQVVNVHYLNQHLQMQSKVLGLRRLDEANAPSLAGHIKWLLERFEVPLSKVAGVTSDNASVNPCTAALLGVQSQGCVAHTLHLVLMADASKHQELKGALKRCLPVHQLLQKIRGVMTHLKNSYKQLTAIDEFQRDGSVHVGPITDVCTRWGATYHMLQRALDLRGYIESASSAARQPRGRALKRRRSCEEPSSSLQAASDTMRVDELPPSSLHFEAEQWRTLEQLCALLHLFETVTTFLSGSSYPTRNVVIPILALMVQGLDMAYAALSSPTEVIAAFWKILWETLETRLKPILLSNTLLMLCWLDPEYKDFIYWSDATVKLTKTSKADAIQLAAAETTKCLESLASLHPIVVTPPPPPLPTSGLHMVMLALESRRSESREAVTASSTVKAWESRFFDMSARRRENGKLSQCGLQSWCGLVQDPQLAPLLEVLLKYACVPATSVMCEEVFSDAGFIKTRRRNRLSTVMLEALLFLRRNTE
jgi:hypothetical protein